MKRSPAILFAVFLLSTSGCSQKFSDSFATAYEAALGGTDVILDKQSLTNIPYASSYFKINQGPQIFMVLAYADANPETGNTQLKWMSSDNAMIVTENGRVTKTLNLPDYNLSSFSSNLNLNTFTGNKAATVIYDWQPRYQFNVQATAAMSYVSDEVIQSTLWSQRTQKWNESITLFNNAQYENAYWVDSNGIVLKSKQWVIPGKLYIEQEVLKTYLNN